MSDIPWGQVFQAGGVLAVVGTIIGAVMQHRTATLQAERNAAVQIATQENQQELGYVDRLQQRILLLENENKELYHQNQELTIRAIHADDRIMQVVRYAASLESKLGASRDILIADLLTGTPIQIATIQVAPVVPVTLPTEPDAPHATH